MELLNTTSLGNYSCSSYFGTPPKVMLVNQSEKVISSFYKDLTKTKSEQLKNEFTNIFNSLHSKKDMIEKIHIDPETFEITLYRKNNRTINKNSLSSGELEIYAMSMVWALAKMSGQQFPFIIDTPLGRLDSRHRDNLLNVFFQKASHQMVVFSTDTEVDKSYFNILRPSISKAYIIKHNDNKKMSEIKEGYFWN